LRHTAVHRPVQRIGKLGLETRRIDENVLRIVVGQMPVTRCRVVCALRETMLIFSPINRLSSVDLPTLGRPTMAI
jgi:hypothetical protein